MGISRDTLDQLRHVLRPLATRVANTVARGVIQFVDDGKKQQLVQIGVLAGETVDSAEHFHPYGLSSVPEAGAEAVVLFPNGDRSHPLVVAVSDRRCRPTGGKSGDVIVYNKKGAKIILRADSGDIEIQPGPGGQVLIRDEGGNADRLVKRSEFLAHGHATAAPGPVSPPTMAPAPAPDTGQFPGTQRLSSQ